MTSPPRRRRARVRSAAGLTLVELLVALAVGTLVLTALALLSSGVVGAFDADADAADQQQRARAGLATMLDDVAQAGSGFIDGVEAAPGWGAPALLPDRARLGAWTVSALPSVVTTVAGRRSAAHAALAVPAPAGTARLTLTPPAYCGTPTCGFAAGDDVVVTGADGRVALSTVQAVWSPLAVDVAPVLGESFQVGAHVSAVSVATYGTRADPATGLLQLTRSRGAGPATTVVDFVRAFDVEWQLDGPPPLVRTAPDGTEEGTTDGPRPPPAHLPGDPSWPAGENCAFVRSAADLALPRLGTLGADAVATALATLSNGPWCPSATAAGRWDADLARVAAVRLTMRVAAAAAHLRSPATVLSGPRRSNSRLVPDLSVSALVRRGRRGWGA